MNITTTAMDLAKSVFQVALADDTGRTFEFAHHAKAVAPKSHDVDNFSSTSASACSELQGVGRPMKAQDHQPRLINDAGYTTARVSVLPCILIESGVAF